jgi:hypothetical protein
MSQSMVISMTNALLTMRMKIISCMSLFTITEIEPQKAIINGKIEIEQLEEDSARKCRVLEGTVERDCEGEGFRRKVPYLEKNKPKITKVAVLILASFVFNSSIDESIKM